MWIFWKNRLNGGKSSGFFLGTRNLGWKILAAHTRITLGHDLVTFDNVWVVIGGLVTLQGSTLPETNIPRFIFQPVDSSSNPLIFREGNCIFGQPYVISYPIKAVHVLLFFYQKLCGAKQPWWRCFNPIRSSYHSWYGSGRKQCQKSPGILVIALRARHHFYTPEISNIEKPKI